MYEKHRFVIEVKGAGVKDRATIWVAFCIRLNGILVK